MKYIEYHSKWMILCKSWTETWPMSLLRLIRIPYLIQLLYRCAIWIIRIVSISLEWRQSDKMQFNVFKGEKKNAKQNEKKKKWKQKQRVKIVIFVLTMTHLVIREPNAKCWTAISCTRRDINKPTTLEDEMKTGT